MAETTTGASRTWAPRQAPASKDHYSREIRFDLGQHGDATGAPGVYALDLAGQEALLLEGHLPNWGRFLPDFVIVLGIGDAATSHLGSGDPRAGVTEVVWRNLRVHVGGLQWVGTHHDRGVETPTTPMTASARRSAPHLSASTEWHNTRILMHGAPWNKKAPAPGWLLDLIRERTPWANLLDRAAADPYGP